MEHTTNFKVQIMKANIVFLSIFLSTASVGFSQNKVVVQSIISRDAAIRKYHELDELKGMQKGQLLELYTERFRVLTKILPNIALAKTPGVTIADLGIPNDAENRKTMEAQTASTTGFIVQTEDFQRKMLPYSDKNTLISAILFYESTLKSLHEFEGL